MSSINISHLNTLLAQNIIPIYEKSLGYAIDENFILAEMVSKKMDHKSETNHFAVEFANLPGIQHRPRGSVADLSTGSSIKTGTFTWKHMSQLLSWDRFTIEMSASSKGAFLNLMSDALSKARRSQLRDMERQIIRGDSTGALGTISGAPTDNGGGSYTFTISEASWAPGVWEPMEIINFGSGTSPFRVEGLNIDTRQVTAVRQSGSDVPVDTDVVYKHRSKDNELVGLKEIIEGSSSLYGIPRQFGWESTKVDRTGKTLTEEFLIRMMDTIKSRCGVYPNMLLLSREMKRELMRLAKANSIRVLDSSNSTTRVLPDGSAKTVSLPSITSIELGGRAVKLYESDMMAPGSGYFLNLSSPDYLCVRSVGAGKFMKGAGDAILEYHGRQTANDVYSALFIMDYAITGHPNYHGGWVNSSYETLD